MNEINENIIYFKTKFRVANLFRKADIKMEKYYGIFYFSCKFEYLESNSVKNENIMV
jgi:hypothetical protein